MGSYTMLNQSVNEMINHFTPFIFDTSYTYMLVSEQSCNSSDLHSGIIILHFPKSFTWSYVLMTV